MKSKEGYTHDVAVEDHGTITVCAVDDYDARCQAADFCNLGVRWTQYHSSVRTLNPKPSGRPRKQRRTHKIASEGSNRAVTPSIEDSPTLRPKLPTSVSLLP